MIGYTFDQTSECHQYDDDDDDEGQINFSVALSFYIFTDLVNQL